MPDQALAASQVSYQLPCCAADKQEREGPQDLLPMRHAQCHGGGEEHQ